ncbi:hypothetical protein G7B40_031300 [Aetokthonos hydrillicola Thurmond2011]|uniref:Uncharacterized protein n=1 Tax=Aetokthonos hydrillicola Thurmond2011 TaxID=2712845 RepID=A0AAP5MCB9_9CYAN|nr:hypothetical protein [Aetokthonos hydrillicola]MBO3463261.1 hypothetical protein [Aetokthonos hydrillicola CCALA 1050]MBW4590514.1 hypothetical protein [Aetokthonos hydrillicola CCALA 1050]MDR9899012.1 hypothetical protein [Aetokthonos hydrillicola Thurmond2011]
MYNSLGDPQFMLTGIAGQFQNQFTRNIQSKTKKIRCKVFEYYVDITETGISKFIFYINAQRMPDYLKSGTADCESVALEQARDNLRQWFKQDR